MSKIGNAGKIYLVPSLPQPASLAMNLFLIRLDEEKIYNEFLFLYLQSDDGKKQIQQRLKGAVTKTITKDNVRSIEVPEFDLDSQKRIAEKLRTLDEKTNKLKSLYQLKIQLMQRLKVSVLKQYFSLDMEVAA
jgi:type I restriction enzyme S subunit